MLTSKFTILTARAFLLQLAVFAGLSFGGLHVHHHGDASGLHVAPGEHCSTACHDVCESESPADHLLEMLGLAAKVSLPGEYLADLQSILRSPSTDEIGFASHALVAPSDRVVLSSSRRLYALDIRHSIALNIYRSGSTPRAPPAFAS